ncbi:Signal transduction histidine-protein kinase/phosphatase DegS [Bacillus sp. THAF10]|uniref:sensor histidine kinase n=1 Tax=Bacillus sp. THAF10 TaxID=2587848 RepID=UPI0012681B24|nr:sensor histidine kinase [Bacillus sp. THAF10]QFT90657.1 Signal transduction histidine-protein kinase/phosphatase DegS [Bacillus sp. THAF10]
MSRKVINSKQLDMIIEQMVNAVEASKDEIFEIGENSRKEFESLGRELNEVKLEVTQQIQKQDMLEGQVRKARNRLSEVSRQFKNYTEEQIRQAYDHAHELQLELHTTSQKEMQLRNRRNEIERRLLNLEETISKADRLVSQVSVVLNYVTSDLQHVGQMIADASEKREFGFKIMEAQEEERRRLSREIHDGPAQMLANVMMRSDLIDRTYRERGPGEALSEIRALKVMVRSALYEVRRIIYDLRPMALDDLGLVPTLKKYISTIEDYHKGYPRIEFFNLGVEHRLSANLEVAVFRLVQESLTNAIKHAQASSIQVKLEIKPTHITVIVKDDGVGFDTTEKKEKSFGLIGMRERVQLISGELEIQSQPDKGTTVFIKIPLS